MTKVFLLLSPLLLSAGLTLDQLQQKPKGHIRDFQIWQYMQGDINATDADRAYSLVQNKDNKKILKVYTDKTNDVSVKKNYQCLKGDIDFLLNETDADCIEKGLSYVKAMQLSDAQRAHFSEILKEKHPKKSVRLTLMNKRPFFSNLLESGSDHFLKLFNNLGKANRQKYFNIKLSKQQINALADDNRFGRAIKYIVTDPKMDKMQEALLDLNPHELSSQAYFFLALNALKFKAIHKASLYLEISHHKAYYQMDKDRALFWQYLILDDRKYLQELSRSTDINIYSLFAREKFHLKTENYFSHLDLDDVPSSYDLSDPYVWQETLNKIRSTSKEELTELREAFNSKSDEVVNAFIYSKALDYKVHNYIMPFRKATNGLSDDQKALVYALGRQESHFVPSAISRSYALGVMQMMPFLIKSLAEQKKEKVELEEMFDPHKNIRYSISHIRYLQKYLYHPLFIAYAYNGGIGFTKRYLLDGRFMRGSFEPFLSMELMANTESREYGKKVLANYVIYKQIIGDEVSISSLFETLTEPSYTDRFRMDTYAKK